MKGERELKFIRSKDVYEAYKTILETGIYKSDGQVANALTFFPAPRFYIDSRTCLKIMCRMLDGHSLAEIDAPRRERFYILFERLCLMMNSPEYKNTSLTKLCEIMVEQPAPRFYLGEQSIRKIIAAEKNKERERNEQKYHL